MMDMGAKKGLSEMSTSTTLPENPVRPHDPHGAEVPSDRIAFKEGPFLRRGRLRLFNRLFWSLGELEENPSDMPSP